MIVILAAAAALAMPPEAQKCADAVRADSAEIAGACSVAHSGQIDIWSGKPTPSPSCAAMMRAGVAYGRYSQGSWPAVMVAGVRAEFERLAQVCVVDTNTPPKPREYNEKEECKRSPREWC